MVTRSTAPVRQQAIGNADDTQSRKLQRNDWDEILHFHERAHSESPSGKAGLAALRRIREIAEPYWQPPRMGQHPLKSRFWVAYELNYRWLIHFAVKLEELLQISGYEHVLSRLGAEESFPSGSSEMDFALRLRLSGFPSRFGFRRRVPTPDITAEVAGEEVDCEVTSLNKPYEDAVGIEALSSVTMIGLRANCVSGGLWGHVPSKKELDEVRTEALKKVAEAEGEHKMVELNIPGVLTCYVAPRDLASEIPEMWRGSFVMRTKSRTPKKDRLAQVITKKARLQLSRGKPGILVVYDRFSSPDETEGFFDEKEIELVVGAFRDLAGVILVYPFNALGPPLSRRVDKGGRTYLEHSLPDGEAERCVIWRNPMHPNQSVLEPVVDSLTDFPTKLTNLFGTS